MTNYRKFVTHKFIIIFRLKLIFKKQRSLNGRMPLPLRCNRDFFLLKKKRS